MKIKLKWSALLLACTAATPVLSQTKAEVSQPAKASRPITRILWQDNSNHTLKWSDLTRGSNGLAITQQPVVGFPKLDAAQQSFVQMEDTNGIVVVGIHDNDNGNFQSGWVALHSGVVEEEHGDHSHWHFEKPPAVAVSQLGKDQGNPAHVYNYQGDIFLANDKKNGSRIVAIGG